MSKLSAFLLAISLLSAPAFAEGVTGSCRLLNAAGTAGIEMRGGDGEIKGYTGTSEIKEISASTLGAWLTIDITYISQLAAMQHGHDPVRVKLMLVNSPVTAMFRVNYQGVLLLPTAIPGLTFPGPFQTWNSGWNNPFGVFEPTIIPTGYAAVAAAYCDLQ